jgi:uroporphyrinogen-III synthase
MAIVRAAAPGPMPKPDILPQAGLRTLRRMSKLARIMSRRSHIRAATPPILEALPETPLHSPLSGCAVISLRPVGDHEALRRAAAAHGARTIALSPWKLVVRDDDATRVRLHEALAAPHVIVTSPAAARAARALQPLRERRGQRWYAVGDGTAAALRHAGIARVWKPERMDSEGLLAMPELHDIRGASVAVLTAPGGRDRIAPTLQRRGARLRRVDVYERVPVPPSQRGIATLRALDKPAWLMLSSGEALQTLLAALPPDATAILRRARVSAASARLAELARGLGWTDITIADNARPRSLLAAAKAAQAQRR